MKIFVKDLGARRYGVSDNLLKNIGCTTILLEWREKNTVLYRMLLDMGLKGDYNPYPIPSIDTLNWSIVEDIMLNKRLPEYKGGIQSIVLSHVHEDHAGGLPWFYEMMRLHNVKYKDDVNQQIVIPQLYTTQSTWKQFEIYQDDLYELFHKPAENTGEHYCWDKNVFQFIASNKDYTGYYRPFPIVINKPKDFDIMMQYIPAGHIPGSAMIEIDTLIGGKSMGKVLYTGDISTRRSSFLVDPADHYKGKPKDVLKNTHYAGMITEFTYGFNRLSNQKLKAKDVLPILMRKVNDTIGQGGNVVLLVYGIDRTANVLAALTRLLRDKKLFVNPNKIWLHTKIGVNITEEYLNEFYAHKYSDDAEHYLAYSHVQDFDSGNGRNIFELGKDTGPIFQIVRSSPGSPQRNAIIRDGIENGGYIVVATSATMNGGTAFMVDSYAHPNGWGNDKKNLFLIVGSAIPDTGAQRALNEYYETGSCTITYSEYRDGEFYSVDSIFSATLEDLSEFSAHANFVELEGLINNLKPDSLIVTHMGSPPSKDGKKHILRCDEATIYVHDTFLLGADPKRKMGEKLDLARRVYVMDGELWGHIDLQDYDDIIIKDETTKDMIRTKVKKEKHDINHGLICDEIRRWIDVDNNIKAGNNKV